MEALLDALQRYLASEFKRRVSRQSGRVQPIFVGPPDDVLRSLFERLTQAGTQDWNFDPEQNPSVVLLVESADSTPASQCRSRHAGWDYAVGLRNSVSHMLVLSKVDSWERCPESLVTATDTMGITATSRLREELGSSLWQFLLSEISKTSGVEGKAVLAAFSEIVEDLRKSGSTEQDFLWTACDRALGSHDLSSFVQSVGFPDVDEEDLVGSSAKVLRKLADLCASHGFSNSQEQLLESAVRLGESGEPERDFSSEIKILFLQLQNQTGTGSRFRSCPPKNFHPVLENWWEHLSAKVLEKLLGKEDKSKPESISLRCTNRLDLGELVREEPAVVWAVPEFHVIPPEGIKIEEVKLARRYPKANKDDFVLDAAGKSEDPAPPPHVKSIRYQASHKDCKPGKVSVLSLDTFECGAFLKVEGASKNPPPTKNASGEWEQHVVISRASKRQVWVVRSGEAGTSVVWRKEDGSPERLKQQQASVLLELESNDMVCVQILDSSDTVISEWEAAITVEETDQDAQHTRYEALVIAHQQKKDPDIPQVQPRSNILRTIEKEILGCMKSWQPIRACWSSDNSDHPEIDWKSHSLGDVTFTGDIRPDFSENPPQDFLDQYRHVRDLIEDVILENGGVFIGDAELHSPNVVRCAKEYLEAYRRWYQRDPHRAVWASIIALHASRSDSQSGVHQANREPTVLLLSPVHPLRLAWMVNAHKILHDGLKAPCPASSLLECHEAPSFLRLPVFASGALDSFSSFSAARTSEPHWQLLWNTSHLDPENDGHHQIAKRLEWLGLNLSNALGGFSSGQVEAALTETTKLLPARATLRTGYVGTAFESQDCVDGLVGWCAKRFALEEDTEREPFLREDTKREPFPREVEVYDLGSHNDEHPSPAQLSSLSDVTEEAVRWYRAKKSEAPIRKDLVLLDEIQNSEPEATSNEYRSPIGISGLTRIHIRRDYDSARIIEESRVATCARNSSDLSGVVEACITELESLFLDVLNDSHLRFHPNQTALHSRLQESLFLAVSSNQVDSACFIRGASAASAYLWDYDLPSYSGVGQGKAGYYLLTKPVSAMKQSIDNALRRLVSEDVPSVESVLEEISCRGIPVLKRLALGGSSAKGEVGVLLALHALQDAFREANSGVRLAPNDDHLFHFVLSVDSFWAPFKDMRRALNMRSGQRPDLFVFAVDARDRIRVKVTPVEVKFRSKEMSRADMEGALAQAANLGKLLATLWRGPFANELWKLCGRMILGQALDICFRVYGEESLHKTSWSEWVAIHTKVIAAVLSGTAELEICDAGRLFVFDDSSTTQAVGFDNDGRPDTGIFNRQDAARLLSESDVGTEGIARVVRAMNFSLVRSGEGHGASTPLKPSEQQHDAQPIQAVPAPKPPVDESLDEENSSSEEAPTSEPSDAPTRSAIRGQIDAAFVGFVGNARALRPVRRDLIDAFESGSTALSRNYLFTGEPSTGKTELARRFSRVLGHPLIYLDGRSVTTRDRLMELVRRELSSQGQHPERIGTRSGLDEFQYPALIIFVDEVHLVKRPVQESFLTVLERGDRTMTLGNEVARLDKATFIFATTRSSELDPAFVSRCYEIPLQEYNAEEVARIVRGKFSRTWSEATYHAIANLGRLVPRIALEIAEDLDKEIRISDNKNFGPDEHLQEIRREREIDENGLGALDRRYLDILEAQNRPVGEKALIRMLGSVDGEKVVTEIEPVLRRMGFIIFGATGREITNQGKEYILAWRRQRSQ